LLLSTEARTFVIVGVLGGFTTFSSFSLDTLALARDGHLGQAFWNVAGQVGLSLLAVWVGFQIGKI
jgi:CrcB protein